jgi:hypothetical protein
MATYTCYVSTGALMHRVAKQWLAIARVRFGLAATYENDGGWLTRNHWLRVKGPQDAVRQFAVVFERWAKTLDDD